jgi:hypothetical protein
MIELTDIERIKLREARRRRHRSVHKPERTITEHEAAVQALCASDSTLLRDGFRAAVLRKWTYTDSDVRMVEGGQWDHPKGRPIFRDEIIDDITVRPDAWKIVDDELHCYEIVHTCHLTAKRRHAYANLWFALDCDYVTVRLFVGGTVGAPGEVRLIDWYGRYVLEPRIARQRAEAASC